MIGKFSWIELVTTDVPRSKDFYGEILGWSFWDNSSLYGNYNLALKDGKMICGIYKSSKLDGLKAHWNSYIFVEDIDYVVKQAVALGGTLERGRGAGFFWPGAVGAFDLGDHDHSGCGFRARGDPHTGARTLPGRDCRRPGAAVGPRVSHRAPG